MECVNAPRTARMNPTKLWTPMPSWNFEQMNKFRACKGLAPLEEDVTIEETVTETEVITEDVEMEEYLTQSDSESVDEKMEPVKLEEDSLNHFMDGGEGWVAIIGNKPVHLHPTTVAFAAARNVGNLYYKAFDGSVYLDRTEEDLIAMPLEEFAEMEMNARGNHLADAEEYVRETEQFPVWTSKMKRRIFGP
jgi:hypothetical protein